jgi:hypothetical protein
LQKNGCGGCVRRAGHLDCARTSAQYGAADARDGARVTLGVAPGILERGAPWGGPRWRVRGTEGQGPCGGRPPPTWFRASADRGGGGVCIRGLRQLPRDSPQRTCVPTQLMCMGVCASHRGRRRSGLHPSLSVRRRSIAGSGEVVSN